MAAVLVGIAPERAAEPPILKELKYVESELRADIDDVEQHLNGHIDNLYTLPGKLLEDLNKKVMDSNLSESVAKTVGDLEELKNQVDSIVRSSGLLNREWIGLIAGFIGGLIPYSLSYGESKLNSPSKNTSKLSTHVLEIN